MENLFNWILILIGIGLLLVVILVPSGISNLDPLHYALEYNKITKQFSSEYYEPGRHFIGINHVFQYFPKDTRYMIFGNQYKDVAVKKKSIQFENSAQYERYHPTINARSRQGVYITTSEDKKEKAKQLKEIYERWYDQYDEIIAAMVKYQVHISAYKFNTSDFYTKRDEIRNDLQNDIKLRLASCCYIKVVELSLMNLNMPVLQQKAIEATEIVRQEIQLKTQEKDEKQINTKTNELKAEIDAEIIKLDYKQNAESYANYKQATSDSNKYIIEKQSETLLKIDQILSFTNESGGGDPTKKQKILGQKYMDVLTKSKQGIMRLKIPSVFTT